MRRQRHWVGMRVEATVGHPVRCGTVVRDWWPYAQLRIRWDDGTVTNIDIASLRVVREGQGTVTEEP